MSIENYFELAEKDLPKPTREHRRTGMGNPYIWLAYDFDEINEWVAKWLQNHEEQMSTITHEKRSTQ